MVHRFILVPVLLASMLLSGCIYSREIARTRRQVERQLPDVLLHREMVLNVGPGSLGFMSLLTRLVPDDDARQATALLQDLDRVKVGIYEVENLSDPGLLELPRLERLQRDGWELAVRTREADAAVWVLYRERAGMVRDLYVFSLDKDEFVIARLSGDFQRLLAHLMAEGDLNLGQATAEKH